MFCFQSVTAFVIPVLISLLLYAVKQTEKESVSGFEICLYSMGSVTPLEVIPRLFKPEVPMCSNFFVQEWKRVSPYSFLS